jgi:steroid delta-isomerase-like uncharacterized protein
MLETEKAAIRRIYDEVWNKKNLEALDEIAAPNLVTHDAPAGLPAGVEGWKTYFGMILKAFPDTKFTIEDQIGEGSKVVTRWSTTGTQTGEFMGNPPSGKKISITGIEIDRFANGKIVEDWSEFDQMSLMTQIGIVPMPGD